VRKVKKRNLFEKMKDKVEDLKEDLQKKNSPTRRTPEKRKDDTVKSKSTTSKSKSNGKSKNLSRSNKNKKGKKNKAGRSLWKKILTVILIIGIAGILLMTLFFGYIVVSSPKFSESAFNVKDQTVVYDKDGNIMATLGTQKRESVTYDELPQVLIDAIIATEDSRFFQHNGVDLPRFIKATLLQLVGRDAGGASTLTMQAVKNNLTKKDSFESNKIQKIIRKFQDVYLAVFKVEKEYSKEEIIELYVNNYNLGSNVYGVQEASKYYFGKNVSELTLPEASLIAGLFQAPNGHNPYKNMDSAISRRNTVLDLMVRHGYITKDEAAMAKKVTIESLLANNNTETEYQGFIDVVVKEVEELTGDNPYTVPMKIYTTMERSIQDGINDILTNNAWYWHGDDLVQAGIAVVNVETGAISAVGNGRNRTGVRIFNYATEALKQPGSTAKPIFDYGPGIEYNNFSSYTLFNDEPWTYTNGPSVNNWDGGFHGLVTTRYALQYSRNVPALKAFQQVGTKNSQKFAHSLGLDVSLNSSSDNYRVINKNTGLDNTINEAYSIGGVAEGFTPLDMAAAYSGFASGGYYTEPYSVTKIEYRESGDVKEYKPTKTRVMKDSTAYIMNNILESAVSAGFHGGTKDAYNSGSHIAAKTGTTNYDTNTINKYNLPGNAVNDLWTVAYTSQYSIAVWYGYDSIYNKEANRVTYNTSSGGYKEGVVRDVMAYIPKDTKGWTAPSSVVCLDVERETWPVALPSANTPSNQITNECFVRGTQPTEVSERYATLNEITDVKVTNNNKNSATITWKYTTPKVLTESYLKEYFNNSVYGNQKDSYYNKRLTYNKDTLGEVGFGIYKQETNGTLTLITFVTENKYTLEGYGDTTIVIKAEHQKFKSNASAGTKVSVSLGNAPLSKLMVTLNGLAIISTKVGTYEEQGLKSIQYITTTEGSIDVTKTAKIKYQISANSTLKEFTTAKELETYVNSLEAGKYKITYVVSYLNQEETRTRTVTLKS